MSVRRPDADPAALADRLAVGDVCVRYATALDTRDFDLLRACFTDDVVTVYGGGPAQHGVDAFVDTTRRWLTPVITSLHQITNVVVELDGDAARSTCAVRADHVHRDLPGKHLEFVGRYVDAHVRTEAGWRIAERAFEIWWVDGDGEVLGWRS